MRGRSANTMLLLLGLLVVLGLMFIFVSPAGAPVAIVHVVDATGSPVAGATLAPAGLRTGGMYSADWYSWDTPEHPATRPPPRTDAQGLARVPYPAYVFERAQTRVIIVTVSHPEFVSSQVELPVTPLTLPWGASFSVWLTFFNERVLRHNAPPRPPIVLAKGATLRISSQPGASGPSGGILRVLLAHGSSSESEFWTNPAPETVVTRSLAAGSHMFQAVQIDSAGVAWFSDVKTISAVTGRTNDVTVTLRPGNVLTGQLDSSVPRPVNHGRLIVNIAPSGIGLSNNPPEWHAWAAIDAGGRFTLRGLPSGDLEVIALCDRFVNTNGPGKYHFHYPQKFDFSAGNLSIIVGMEPTACLKARVLDGNDKPLKDATVALWPNVHYGEWSARILGSDCFNTADSLSPGFKYPKENPFTARTDASGIAVIPNLPLEANAVFADHPQWNMPLASSGFPGQQRREQAIKLVAGQTNSIIIKMEPRNHSVISQY